MLTTQGTTITKTDPYRHKFSSALAEFVYDDMDRWADRASGDSESPIGWFAPIGAKRLLRGDERGFVWVETYGNEHERDMVRGALDLFDATWSGDDIDVPDDIDMDADDYHQSLIDVAGRFVSYVYACDAESCDALTFDMWTSHNEPRGPIG